MDLFCQQCVWCGVSALGKRTLHAGRDSGLLDHNQTLVSKRKFSYYKLILKTLLVSRNLSSGICFTPLLMGGCRRLISSTVFGGSLFSDGLRTGSSPEKSLTDSICRSPSLSYHVPKPSFLFVEDSLARDLASKIPG